MLKKILHNANLIYENNFDSEEDDLFTNPTTIFVDDLLEGIVYCILVINLT